MDKVDVMSEKVSRRKFLQIAGVASASSFLAFLLKGSEVDKSPEKELPKVAVLDLFGLKIPETGAGIATKVMEEYALHGEKVVRTLTRTADLTDPGNSGKLVILPFSIVSAVTVREIEPDRLGNPQIEMDVSKDEIEKMVKGIDAGVVNMSFELGVNRIKYKMYSEEQKYPEMGPRMPQIKDGGYVDYLYNPISEEQYKLLMAKSEEKVLVTLSPKDRMLKFVDGYAGEDTFQNLSLLAELAAKFPDKSFVAAGGNPTFTEEGLKTPDIRAARKILTEKGLWPNNLLIVGVEGESHILGCLGADIYVNEKDLARLGADTTSSCATPVVTELVRQKGKQNVLERMTETKEWWGMDGNERMEYKVVKLPNDV